MIRHPIFTPMWTIDLPIRVVVNKKTTFSLNLNQYRNTHHYTLNAAKVNYTAIVKKLINHLPKIGGCKLKYTLYVPSNRRVDISNICSIVDKFFCDALVEQGKIEDDSYDFIKEVSYCFGGIDKANPRVEVLIEEAEPIEEEIMQITINQTEIEQAITAHIKSQITIRENMEIKIDIRATRGAEGMTAMIDIVPSDQPAAAPVAQAVRTTTPVRAEVQETPAEEAAPEVDDAAPPEVETTPDPKPTKSGLFNNLNKA